MSLRSGYHRAAAIEALAEGFVKSGVDEDLAEQFATRAVDSTLECAWERGIEAADGLLARIANLRACLASIEARADRRGFLGQPFEGLAGIAQAARGALEADDRAAHPMRIFAAAPDGNTTITERPPER